LGFDLLRRPLKSIEGTVETWEMGKFPRQLQDSPEAVFRREVLERLALSLGVIVGFSVIARHLSAAVKTPQLVVAGILTVMILLTPVLTRRVKSAALAAVPVCIALLGFALGSGLLYGAFLAPGIAMLPLLPLIAFCFGGKRLASVIFTCTILTAGFLYIADVHGWTRPAMPHDEQTRNSAIVLSFITCAAYAIGAIYERSRRVAEQHLVEASRLASLGVMAGGVAHELNNPLMIAESFARNLLAMAQRGDVDPKVVERISKNLVASTERMASIVSGLRVYSRDDASEALAPVAVARIVEDTLLLCQERFRHANIDLRIAPVAPDLKIMARPVQISQTLHNLLNNAFDAVVNGAERWVALKVEAEGKAIVIRVSDSGAGIKPDVRSKIFIPFFTTKPVGHGVGLGLSVCASIMHGHGGEVFLDQAQADTTFVLRFPAVSTGRNEQSIAA
jgi:signal transduction histidine kinase